MLEKILGILQPEKSFDLVRRDMEIAGRPCTLLFVDGMIKDEVMEKMLEYFLKLDHSVWDQTPDMQSFSRRIIPYVEVADEDQLDAACTAILSGNLGLFIQGFSSCTLIDIRTYPARSVEEPEKDKVLRGSRDGFVETVVFNTALIRRRIRDPKLTMSILSAGESSHTDIVVCYMENRADLELVQRVKERDWAYQGTGVDYEPGEPGRSADFQQMAQSLSQNTLYRTAGYCRCRLAGGPHHHPGRQFPLCYDSAIWHF